MADEQRSSAGHLAQTAKSSNSDLKMARSSKRCRHRFSESCNTGRRQAARATRLLTPWLPPSMMASWPVEKEIAGTLGTSRLSHRTPTSRAHHLDAGLGQRARRPRTCGKANRTREPREAPETSSRLWKGLRVGSAMIDNSHGLWRDLPRTASRHASSMTPAQTSALQHR